MGKYPLTQPAPNRAWQDTWKFLLNTKIGYILGVVVIGVVSAILVPSGDKIWLRLIVGAIGAIIGLAVIVALTFIVFLLITPYRQRNEARTRVKELEESLGDLGYIESFMWEKIEDVDKLRYYKSQGLPLDDRDLNRFRGWFGGVSEWLQKNMNSETVNWYNCVNIPLDKSTLDDVIQAYESGFTILRELQKDIVPVVRKEDSQT